MQATGRMAGHTGLPLIAAAAAGLIALSVVVGIILATQRLSIGGGAVATPAPDAGLVQKALNNQRLGEKQSLGLGQRDLAEFPGTAPKAVIVGGAVITLPAAKFDVPAFRVSEREPLVGTGTSELPDPRARTRGADWDEAHHRSPVTSTDDSDANRGGGYRAR